MKEIDLRKAADCRWYIDHFDHPAGKITYVELSGGRRVEFHKMSDEDAILIANELYQMELEGTARSKKRVIDEGGLVQ